MSRMKKPSVMALALVVGSTLSLILFGILRDDTQPRESVVRVFPDRMVQTLFTSEATRIDWSQNTYQLVNVWASWCGVCVREHPFLNQLAKQGIPIIGLNYRDRKGLAHQYINKHGNPYEWVIFDPKGEFALDLGVLGTPETYLVDGAGRIVLKHTGRLTQRMWQDHFMSYFEEIK